MKILLWGAGKKAESLLREIKNNPEIYKDDILAIVDNNKKLWGKHRGNFPVISPEKIKEYSYEKIVLTTIYIQPIKHQLSDELLIPESKIVTYGEYTESRYAAFAYGLRYNNVNDSDENDYKFNLDRVVVYTAIIGDYDELLEPAFKDDKIDYYCVTDNRELKSEHWKFIYVVNDAKDNVRLARHIKLNPHRFFPDYETSIWVDAKFFIKEDLRKYIIKYEKKSKIIFVPHGARRCLYSEAAVCIYMNKDDKNRILPQIKKYMDEGCPVDLGLYDTGLIVRTHNDCKVISLMEQWEREINVYSARDQISLPYILWKNGYIPDISDIPIYGSNKWLGFHPHKETLFAVH